MPQEGMLVQLDSSHHRWLGGDVPQFALLLVLQLQKCGEEFQAASVMAAPGRCLVPPSPPGPPQH